MFSFKFATTKVLYDSLNEFTEEIFHQRENQNYKKLSYY